MSLLIAVLIFSLVIIVHELGHFLFAKLSGITVVEFSLGMGPRLLSREWHGTRYSLKLLPFGGSCAMLGEDTEEEELEGSFNAASVWKRILVVGGGPLFNILLAFILSVVIVASIGYNPALVLYVEEGSAAEAAGLQVDDVITEYQGYHIDLGGDLYVYSTFHPLGLGEPLSMKVNRDGEELEISFTPDISERYLLGFNRSPDSMEVESLIPGMPLEDAGVEPGDLITSINGVKISNDQEYTDYITEHPLTGEKVKVTYMRDGLEYEVTVVPGIYQEVDTGYSANVNGVIPTEGLGIIRYALLDIKYMIRTTLFSVGQLLTGGLGVRDLSGPVGVVDAIGDTYEQSRSEGALMLWMNMINMAVLLSANLGVMNLLPLPALDGGRLVFLALEAIRRKPLNRRVEGMIHFAGLMLLMVLMVVVMYNDILKLF